MLTMSVGSVLSSKCLFLKRRQFFFAREQKLSHDLLQKCSWKEHTHVRANIYSKKIKKKERKRLSFSLFCLFVVLSLLLNIAKCRCLALDVQWKILLNKKLYFHRNAKVFMYNGIDKVFNLFKCEMRNFFFLPST